MTHVREDLKFDSGGDAIAAWLYRPTAGAGGPVPCVVMAHGFSATRRDRLPAYAERFAAAGFAVLLFDYRGFGESGGRERQVVDIRRQHEDYDAAIATARGLDGVDAARIALFGSSFSGGHVVAVASRHPEVAAVIAQVPFADGLVQLRITPPKVALRATVDAHSRSGRRVARQVARDAPGGRAARVLRRHDGTGGRARVHRDHRLGITLAERRRRADHAPRRQLPAGLQGRTQCAARCSSRSATATIRRRLRPRSRWPGAHRAASCCAIPSATSSRTSASRSSASWPTRSSFSSGCCCRSGQRWRRSGPARVRSRASAGPVAVRELLGPVGRLPAGQRCGRAGRSGRSPRRRARSARAPRIRSRPRPRRRAGEPTRGRGSPVPPRRARRPAGSGGRGIRGRSKVPRRRRVAAPSQVRALRLVSSAGRPSASKRTVPS